MRTKPVTYTIPEQLDHLLHDRVGRGKLSKFVTRALWDALKKEEDALLMEFLGADKDAGNLEVKRSFSDLKGEDFVGVDDFDFEEKNSNARNLS